MHVTPKISFFYKVSKNVYHPTHRNPSISKNDHEFYPKAENLPSNRPVETHYSKILGEDSQRTKTEKNNKIMEINKGWFTSPFN